ncbi:hypothetical protein [Rufibacter tibetensis]|uniref:Uncharacterized protein n=1 Tax=Rufibacter tibetensis TaxID=512763 RepID=A0A0P0C8Y0_9BACT|nr:hypothetical protein [Rufibacter tibetensis]ALI99994.1 hypothetical protein DC20_14685 [Rufibacter tibetensis]
MKGRPVLLKYCILSIAIFLITPLIVDLILQLFMDTKSSSFTFYINLLEAIRENKLFVFIQTLVGIVSIYFLGRFAEKQIVEHKRSSFFIGALTLLSLWLILFLSSMLFAAVESTGPFQKYGFWSVIIGWLLFGLPQYTIYGVLHGLTMGYLVGNEIKNRGSQKYRHSNHFY